MDDHRTADTPMQPLETVDALHSELEKLRAWCLGLEDRQARIVATLQLLGHSADHLT